MGQTQLYELDNEYRPLHIEIRQMQTIKHELEEYTDQYKIQLSQLKRVQQRISSYVLEKRTAKDSSNEAVKATNNQHAWMVSKITNKIVKTQSKIDDLQQNNSNGQHDEELITCKNFLNGLKEFSSGLKKLRKTSTDKVEHLQTIIEQLEAQQSEIGNNIHQIRQQAMQKLNEIRSKYLNQTLDREDDNNNKKQKDENGDDDNESVL